MSENNNYPIVNSTKIDSSKSKKSNLAYLKTIQDMDDFLFQPGGSPNFQKKSKLEVFTRIRTHNGIQMYLKKQKKLLSFFIMARKPKRIAHKKI